MIPADGPDFRIPLRRKCSRWGWLAAVLTGVPALGLAQTAPASTASVSAVRITAPPESFFQSFREIDREAARGFYKKYVDVGGLSLASSAEVADEALDRGAEIASHLLAGRPDILKQMETSHTRLVIIGKDQLYTDMPEYRKSPNAAYWNERVRGTGGLRVTSFGEENLLSLPTDRYDTESIAVHEFCHTIDSALQRIDPTWRERMERTYRNALARGLWKNTYAASNPTEYWAEVCQSYFDCNRPNNWNHGPIAHREQLKIYDPEAYELVKTTFNLSPDQDWRYQFARKLPKVIPPPARYQIDPSYTKFVWAGEFPVIGKGASDEAMLKAGDTVRKMFAYRNDILKALIIDHVKLVVLAPHERLADLPELKEAKGVDLNARFLDATPETKLMVVPEENVLADPADAFVGPALEVRALARALYEVCGTRPVDPHWDERRDVQQYELRVKRLDVGFDERLKKIFDAAMSKGLWKNTAAVHDREAYWAEGVLAYFDAAGQTGAPWKEVDGQGDFSETPHPIDTREALKAYDPDLYALVNETMAYEGRVDWRYRPVSAQRTIP